MPCGTEETLRWHGKDDEDNENGTILNGRDHDDDTRDGLGDYDVNGDATCDMAQMTLMVMQPQRPRRRRRRRRQEGGLQITQDDRPTPPFDCTSY